MLFPCVSIMAATSVDDLKREVEDLRKRLNEKKGTAAPIGSKVDDAVAGKYGPNAAVTTKNGKLTIGGLLQIWNYSVQEDHVDVLGRRVDTVGVAGTNETRDNSTYRIRRAEIKFGIDIHENVTGVVMIDPAAEATSFSPVPSNQGLFKSTALMAPEYDAVNGPGLGSTGEVTSVQYGTVQHGQGGVPRLLQDAYINYHGVVPHHDFTIGQFKPPMGEEGTRDSAYLDFAERAMVTQMNDIRDLGAQVHGSWLQTEEGKCESGRVQYWLGVFDGAGDFFGTAGAVNNGALGQFQNRSDDNDEKDFAVRVLGRPVWNKDAWYGLLELGYSGQCGVHGESGSHDVTSNPLNGLNREQTHAIRHAAWAMYKPMGPVRGMWLRGEYGYQKDRAMPLSVNAYALGGGPNGEQLDPHPFTRDGFYVATGYKLSDSIFADRLSKGGFWNRLFEPVEFAFRYERFANIVSEDLSNPDIRTDIFRTSVFTAGVNYYVKHYNARVQVNFMIVDEEEDNNGNADVRGIREVKNNVLLLTYQIAF
ncbi:MAG: porin [Planctomycetota bacterium]|nr:porin [Planctomycetota bacterium]